MADTKTEVKTKTPDYPLWPGPENAESGKTYKLEKSGNLIQKGDTPE